MGARGVCGKGEYAGKGVCAAGGKGGIWGEQMIVGESGGTGLRLPPGVTAIGS